MNSITLNFGEVIFFLPLSICSSERSASTCDRYARITIGVVEPSSISIMRRRGLMHSTCCSQKSQQRIMGVPSFSATNTWTSSVLAPICTDNRIVPAICTGFPVAFLISTCCCNGSIFFCICRGKSSWLMKLDLSLIHI